MGYQNKVTFTYHRAEKFMGLTPLHDIKTTVEQENVELQNLIEGFQSFLASIGYMRPDIERHVKYQEPDYDELDEDGQI
jgi:hypothetical protein